MFSPRRWHLSISGILAAISSGEKPLVTPSFLSRMNVFLPPSASIFMHVTPFWAVNLQRDSVELLRGFLNAFPDAHIHICRNMYFGAPQKFALYNESKAREIIERKGLTLDFPGLADRVADKLYSGRIPIWIADRELPLGDRVELRRWRQICAEMFQAALGGK